MADQFLGEIRAVPFNFAPTSWAFCDGALLPISQNTALFSLLGTTYGGDGISNFALPDLRGRGPLQAGQGPGLSDYVLGETGGEEAHALVGGEIPAHGHNVLAAPTAAVTNDPTQGYFAVPVTSGVSRKLYGTPRDVLLASDAVSTVGGHVAHENRQPYLALNYIIAMNGVFPSRS